MQKGNGGRERESWNTRRRRELLSAESRDPQQSAFYGRRNWRKGERAKAPAAAAASARKSSRKGPDEIGSTARLPTRVPRLMLSLSLSLALALIYINIYVRIYLFLLWASATTSHIYSINFFSPPPSDAVQPRWLDSPMLCNWFLPICFPLYHHDRCFFFFGFKSGRSCWNGPRLYRSSCQLISTEIAAPWDPFSSTTSPSRTPPPSFPL